MDESLLVEGTWWEDKESGNRGTIIDRGERGTTVIFRWFPSAEVGSFCNMDFLRRFKILPSNTLASKSHGIDVGSIWMRKENLSTRVAVQECGDKIRYRYISGVPDALTSHEGYATPENFLKDFIRYNVEYDEISVGSIWEGVRGMSKSDVGRLIKVTHCIGNLIDWNYLKDPDRDHHCTCSSSFKHCFKKVQDNDNDAVYRLIENPNTMVKVVNSHSTSTNGEWIYGIIEYNDIPISKYRHVESLGNFHKKYTLFSLDPIKEFSVDINDPMHANRITDIQEDTKVEDNGTYLKTDKNKLEDFGSGAKREDKSGKGRYDLIPGDVMYEFEDFVWASYFKNGSTTCSPTDVSKSAYFEDWKNVELYYDFIFNMVSFFFVPSTEREECEDDNGEFSYEITWDGFRSGLYEMRKSLAAHYEAGAKIHGVDNWKKGIPVYGSERGGCFLDSMRRHTDQALQGKTDEPHAVAALWNAFCAVWTLKHKPHSAMYQNASAVKAEEKPSSAHFDMIDSAIDALKAMNKDKDTASDTEITTPSGEKFNITKWPDGFIPQDFDKNKFLRDIRIPEVDFSVYNDIIKDLREVSEANRIEEYHKMILKYHDVKYNLLECIKALRDIVTSKNFSRLDTRVTTVYFDIYSALVILHDIINWFHEDEKAIDHIAKIITDIHDMINMGVGHICSCYKIKKLEWETCPEYLRGFECVLGDPNEDKVNILYETIGRAVNGLLNRNESGFDPFCGLGITQSLAKFNTDCLKSRVEKNK